MSTATVFQVLIKTNFYLIPLNIFMQIVIRAFSILFSEVRFVEIGEKLCEDASSEVRNWISFKS